MNMIEIVLTLFLFSLGLYLLGLLIAPKKTRKSKEKYEPFTGGEALPVEKPKYFSHLYSIILLFLIFDAITLIVATASTFNFYTITFLFLIFFISLLVGLEIKKL